MPDGQETDASEKHGLVFALLNEAGIISQLSRALMETSNPDGLSMPQFTVLNHLVRLGGTPSPLKRAQAFQLPKTTMTHTLATLEKRDLIKMQRNAEDGRSKLVHLTPAGSKLVHLTPAGRDARDRAINAVSGEMARLAADVGTDRIADALPVLRDIRTRLDAWRDSR
jgi:DNA-binding MarR family transcriptional regulator